MQDALDKAIEAEPSTRLRVYREDGTMYAGVFVGGRNVKLVGGLEASSRTATCCASCRPSRAAEAERQAACGRGGGS